MSVWQASLISYSGRLHPPASCRIAGVDNKLADVTPVIMNSRPVLMEAGCFGVLLNLDADVPPGFEQFPRVVEIVDEAEDGKLQARKRYRHYQEQGHDVRHHRLDGN